jgi:hypothetical protein
MVELTSLNFNILKNKLAKVNFDFNFWQVHTFGEPIKVSVLKC